MKIAMFVAVSAALLLGGASASADVSDAKLIPVTFDLAGSTVPAGIVPGSIDVMFNPKEYTLTKATPWKHHDIQGTDAPELEFTSGQPFSIRFDLVLDTSPELRSVAPLAAAIAKLAVGTAQPGDPKLLPDCIIHWGTKQFRCVLESFSLRFTLFLEDGTPVRAVMSTVWKEFSPAEEQLRGNPRH